MRIDVFDYDLPPDRIAQYPTPEREQARLLVVPPRDSPDTAFQDRTVADLADAIPEGALVVVNDTRVIPARLLGQKADTGGKVEIFLVRFAEKRAIPTPGGGTREVDVWHAMGKASKPFRFGSDVIAGNVRIHLFGRGEDGLLEVGLSSLTKESTEHELAAAGHVPLPPYIKREDEALDQERYQTVFARVPGALAAPTAGLHLSRALLGRLSVRGCELASVTLHVGLGTFQPVMVDDLDAHPMHSETFEISRTTAAAIAKARDRGAPVVAVGTTVVRALESAVDPDFHAERGRVLATRGETRLLIQPGYRFRIVDQLVTNFHLPRSTLLALVCAFGGYERVLEAYRYAVREGYRFFSYGDAMMLSLAQDPS
ncbi:tRNA preQ1(34) S-adenosylmethionine ribosyltransferase-isomerase QueA [Pendulispora albinea]|uniref:S-adenosylmethionine:tRNA ribosyltransferase-isomerase n=1 Tax=Pendulispora albinea TaxID=2741071 RepID=A0ABZ2M5F7_9BACT